MSREASSRNLTFDKTTRGLELVSLASIFPDEFEELEDIPDEVRERFKADAAQSADSRAFKLRVRAESQPELNHAEVDLWFSLGPDYPAGESSLALFVEGVKGMSDGWVKELDAKLRVLIAELVGREMTFELAQLAQEFLREHNVDPKRSFHDEMLEQEAREQIMREKEELEREQAERKEADELKRERRLRYEAEAQEEVRRRKQLFRKRTNRKLTPQGDMWSSSETEEEEEEEPVTPSAPSTPSTPSKDRKSVV